MSLRLKKIIFIFASVIAIIGVPTLAIADNYGIDRTQQATKGLLPTSIGGAKNIPELIGVVVSIILGFLGIVFFLLVFYSGIIWMTARGDEGKIDDAKKTIEAAIIGLVIIMAAYAITRSVFASLGAKGSQKSSTTAATLGCCIKSMDTGDCTANRLQSSCQAGENWVSGACPVGCKAGPPAP